MACKDDLQHKLHNDDLRIRDISLLTLAGDAHKNVLWSVKVLVVVAVPGVGLISVLEAASAKTKMSAAVGRSSQILHQTTNHRLGYCSHNCPSSSSISLPCCFQRLFHCLPAIQYHRHPHSLVSSSGKDQ